MNLAQQARASFATFLCRDVSQRLFANITQIPIGTIKNWEQGARIPRYSATETLLGLFIHSADFMVPALVQYHISKRLREEVSLELASEIVETVLRGNKTDNERKKALYSFARKLFREKEDTRQKDA